MNVYLVAATDLDDETIGQVFPDRVNVRGGVWVVASALDTCTDVAEPLGMNRELKRKGMVVRIGEYFGFHNRALWDKIEAWRAR